MRGRNGQILYDSACKFAFPWAIELGTGHDLPLAAPKSSTAIIEHIEIPLKYLLAIGVAHGLREAGNFPKTRRLKARRSCDKVLSTLNYEFPLYENIENK